MTDTRALVLKLLTRVDDELAWANLVLPQALRESGLPENDRRFVQELLYGVIRWRGSHRAVIGQLSKQVDAETERILCIGLHQLFKMRVASHAAIHSTVELAKKSAPKSANFVNAVLRNAQRQGYETLLANAGVALSNFQRLAIEQSHPEWVIAEYASALSSRGLADQLEVLLAAQNSPPEVQLAALNETAVAELLARGFERSTRCPTAFFAGSRLSEALEISGVRVQDQGSQLVTLALIEAFEGVGNRPVRALDMCAGPGGKAALLAAKLEETDSLDCLEISETRANLVQAALSGAATRAQTKVSAADARDLVASSYDLILLDAPCSSLGSVRRKPETRWRKEQSQIAALSSLQLDLLNAGLVALKPGGVLAYVTCSPLLLETQAVVRTALETSGFELLNANQVLNQISPQLLLPTDRATAQLWTHLHDTDSMFLALIRKVG